MNKLFTFLASAALISLSACSSDDPAVKGPDGPDKEGTFYLKVNITDADNIGRAGEETSPSEGDLIKGDEFEYNVTDAHFYFFNEEGIYVCEASVWDGGKPTEDTEKNVEYIGENVLVLKGLDKQVTPKYLVTVLNAPSSITSNMIKGNTKIGDLAKMQINYLNGTKFVMSTTSFYDEDDTFYDSKYPYANIVPEGYLKENVTDINPSDFDKTLDIYVERLAAKFTLDKTNSILKQKISLTIAGLGNQAGTTEDDKNQGKTDVEITIDRVGVTYTQETSYLSKDVSSLNTDYITSWTNWNNPSLHRSFWGKSVNYNAENPADGRLAARFFDIDNDITHGSEKVEARYSNEATKPFSKIQKENSTDVNPECVPHFVITATVTIPGKTENTLVRYKGMPYLLEHFTKHILNRLDEAKRLNYYLPIGTDGEGNPQYKQVDFQNIAYKPHYTDVANTKYEQGEVIPYFISGDATVLYAKDETKPDGQQFSIIPNDTEGHTAVEQLNNTLVSLFANDNDYPIYFKDGRMTYTIPVQHLRVTDDSQFTTTKDGEFGVVRNHWYVLTIKTISDLGRGVFDPDEDGDIIKVEDPNKKTWSMAASVKFLSWKVKKQSVKL